jgi:TonB family protein
MENVGRDQNEQRPTSPELEPRTSIEGPMRYLAAAAAVVVAIGAQGAGTNQYRPPRLVDGPSPAPPGQQIVGGGEVLLDLTVGTEGEVAGVGRLRVTPPYTDLVAEAVGSWRFSPAEVTTQDKKRRRVESHVLVAAVYRPPALENGASLGEPPKDVAKPPEALPSPRELIAPPYPPTGRGDATVVLEIEIGPSGNPDAVRVIHSGGGFDSAAIQAAQAWSFAPAHLDARAVPAYAYVIMGLRAPIVAGRGR